MSAFDKSRASLYSIAELFQGYDPARPESFAETLDFRIYKEFVADRGAASTNKPEILARTKHDCTITELFADELRKVAKTVAIMGGHGVLRGSPAYNNAAKVSAELAHRGFTIISGGGPSAMEAVHLGAAVGDRGQALDDALNAIAADKDALDCGGFPVIYNGVAPDLIKVDPDAIKVLARYYKPGWELLQKIGRGGGIAVPTWMYGWEPTTVFTDQVAKYFQNSIREDGLLAAATHGIVYAEGRAGTMQEVFQDAGQNYYRSFPTPTEQRPSVGVFSPMVFLGRFWKWTLPIEPVLQGLFALGSTTDEEAKRVVFAETIEDAVEAIDRFKGLPVATLLPAS